MTGMGKGMLGLSGDLDLGKGFDVLVGRVALLGELGLVNVDGTVDKIGVRVTLVVVAIVPDIGRDGLPVERRILVGIVGIVGQGRPIGGAVEKRTQHHAEEW